jgi:hypothetical protein
MITRQATMKRLRKQKAEEPIRRQPSQNTLLRIWLNIESRLQSTALYESNPEMRTKTGPITFDIDFTNLKN